MRGNQSLAYDVEAKYRANRRAERKEIAVIMMRAIVESFLDRNVTMDTNKVAHIAVSMADALIREIDNE